MKMLFAAIHYTYNIKGQGQRLYRYVDAWTVASEN